MTLESKCIQVLSAENDSVKMDFESPDLIVHTEIFMKRF